MSPSAERRFVAAVDLGAGSWDWELYERAENVVMGRLGRRRARRVVTLQDNLGEVRTKSVADAHSHVDRAGSTPLGLAVEVTSHRTEVALTVQPGSSGMTAGVRIASIDEFEAQGIKAVLENRRSGAWTQHEPPEDDSGDARWKLVLGRLLWALLIGILASLIAGVLLLRFG